MTFFSKERDALVFRYNGETVRIEAWNKDSLRVRSVMVGEISDYIAIEDLGNVLIDQETLADKDILVYDSELGEWKNATLDEVIADWAAEAEAWATG